MLPSEANSAATNSPRRDMSTNISCISRRNIPRRRCVGSTATRVTPPIGTDTRPGRVSSNGSTAEVPTILPRSTAPTALSNGNVRRKARESSSVYSSPKAMAETSRTSGQSSPVSCRISRSPILSYLRRQPLACKWACHSFSLGCSHLRSNFSHSSSTQVSRLLRAHSYPGWKRWAKRPWRLSQGTSGSL